MLIIFLLIPCIVAPRDMPWSIYSRFSYEHCYESFSIPKIIFKLYQYHPSGAKFISVRFLSGISHNSFNVGSSFDLQYYFKKIDEPCNSSLIFSTEGWHIHKMEIVIKIRLSPFHGDSVFMKFLFRRNFKPGVYLLVDEYSHFGIKAEVTYDNWRFMKNKGSDIKARNAYLDSLRIDMSDICVITENNRQVIINPHHNFNLTKGFIVGVKPSFEDIEYHVFECRAPKNYRHDTTVFISKDALDTQPIFNAIYAIWNGKQFERKYTSFYIDNVKLYPVDNMPHFPQNFKKVFLIKKKLKK